MGRGPSLGKDVRALRETELEDASLNRAGFNKQEGDIIEELIEIDNRNNTVNDNDLDQ